MVVMKEDIPSSFPEPFLNQGNEVEDIRKKSSIFRLSKRVPNAPPYFIFLSPPRPLVFCPPWESRLVGARKVIVKLQSILY